MPFQFVASSKLPTQHGHFDIAVFEDAQTGEEHVALSLNMQSSHDAPVLLRLHSECLTGDAFGSLRCDCGPQLNATMQLIQQVGRGMILYLRQEGRGIGLPNKIRAYALQDQGHDTLDANLMLGLPADGRTYDMCKTMLDHFGVSQINLITNNPAKQAALEELGFVVTERTPLHVGYNAYNEGYISTKRSRMGHLE
ncbi:MAG: GTP cyclohydrolase II [Pseudomonadota bacterium]|nr:GTP cyclohydrolase II [Pseudomonadota bacterium]